MINKNTAWKFDVEEEEANGSDRVGKILRSSMQIYWAAQPTTLLAKK